MVFLEQRLMRLLLRGLGLDVCSVLLLGEEEPLADPTAPRLDPYALDLNEEEKIMKHQQIVQTREFDD